MSEHTIHSIGERLKAFHGDFAAFAAKADAKTDEGLVWWRKSHYSALIGVGLLILAMFVGDILGIARLF